MDNQELNAIAEMMAAMEKRINEQFKSELEPVHEKLKVIQEDIEILKEDSTVTRSSANLLLKWAEKADVNVKVGLYDDDGN